MIVLAFNNKSLQECTFEEMVDGLTQHFFLRFMSHGRDGVVAGAQDVVDTMYQHALYKVQDGEYLHPKYGRSKMPEGPALEMKNLLIIQLMDAIITQGTRGIRSVIHINYQLAVVILRDGKLMQ